MKTTVFAVWGLFALMLLPWSAGAAGPGQTVLFAFDADDRPFTYMEKGAATGYSVELLAAILKPQGLDIRHLPLPWEEVLKKLAAGEVHVTTNIAKTPERLKVYAYSALPVSDLRVALFAKTRTGIHGLRDLRGKRVAAEKGTLHEQIVRDNGIQPLPCASETASLLALQDNEADAAVLSLKTALYVMKQRGLKDIRPAGTPLHTSFVYYAVPRGNDALLAVIDEGMRRVQADGTLAGIYRKWFVAEPTPEEIRDLKARAAEAASLAYAPYSRFQVGAAVLAASGTIYTGCNIENALYGYTMSALKVALAKAVSGGEVHFRAVVNVLPEGRLGAPAADERQMLYEFNPDTLVVFHGAGNRVETRMVSELLPYPFVLP